jgi:hypothetical protein
MESLLKELVIEIMDILPMPDKRAFRRTCVKFYKINFTKYERIFLRKLREDGYFRKFCYGYVQVPTSLSDQEIYILEFVYANYEIPEKYITKNEPDIIYSRSKMYLECGKHARTVTIESLLKYEKIINLYYNFDQITLGIATTGDSKLLEWWNLKYPSRSQSCIIEAAAFGGHYHILDNLLPDKRYVSYEILLNACVGNQLKLLKIFHKNGCNLYSSLYGAASAYGLLPIIKWLTKKGCVCDISIIIINAASNGHLEILKWAHKYISEKKIINNEDIFSAAIENGHIETAKWLLDMGCKWNDNTFFNVVKTGRFDVLKELFKMGCPIDPKTCNYCIEKGYLDILIWLHENSNCYKDICTRATICGHLDVLKWAYANKYVVNHQIYELAEKYGHFHILNWMNKKNI